MVHEQAEVENEEGEIIVHSHDLVNIEELITDEFDGSSSRAQDPHMVNNSNCSGVILKTNFQSLYKIIF